MEEPPLWIVVRNWERFQHSDVSRSESAPVWIRNYTRLLHNEEYASLTASDRGALHLCWLRYAAADGQLTVTTLTRRGQLSVTARQLDLLNHAGFLGFSASKPPRLSARLEESRGELKDPKGQAVKGLVGSSSTQDRNGLPDEPHYSLGLEIEVAQIMAGTTDQDDHSEQIVRRYAEQLPLGAIAKVRESAHGKHVRYAVAALKDELRERGKL